MGRVLLFSIAIWVLGGLKAQPFIRLNYALSEQGQFLPNAFIGGLNNPVVAEVDFDMDGINELLVLDLAGNAPLVFRWDQTSDSYQQTDAFQDRIPLEINNWIITRDYNGDGLLDLFSNSDIAGIPGVIVFKGVENEDGLHWERLNLTTGRFPVIYYQSGNNAVNLYVNPGDLPGIADMDADGDLDVISYDVGGTLIYYYRNMTIENGVPFDDFSFILADQCWGRVEEAGLSSEMLLSPDTFSCPSQFHEPAVEIRHSGSSVLPFDLEGDGDYDLLVGDVGSTYISFLRNYRMDGTDYMVSLEPQFPAASGRAVDLFLFPFPMQADVNHDGYEDLLFCSGDVNNGENYNSLWLYTRQPENAEIPYRFEQTDFIFNQLFDGGSEAFPTILDVDGDGLKDLLIGTRGYFHKEIESDPRIFYLRQHEDQGHRYFTEETSDFLGLNQYQLQTVIWHPVAGDLDQDGDLDLIVGDYYGRIAYIENKALPGAPPEWAGPVFDYMGIDVGLNSTPTLYDANQDGLIDLVIGERSGNLNLFLNTGSPGAPFFSAVADDEFWGKVDTRNPYFLAGASSPTVFNNEGKWQMVVGSGPGNVWFYDELATEILQVTDTSVGSLREGINTHVAIGDLDDDGYYDMVVGNRRGGISIFRTPWKSTTTSTGLNPPVASSLECIPNPARNSLRLTGINETGRLQVFGMDGRCWIDDPGFDPSENVDVRSIPSGVYLIHFITSEGNHTGKIIKD